jgi:hypothetical protein
MLALVMALLLLAAFVWIAAQVRAIVLRNIPTVAAGSTKLPHRKCGRSDHWPSRCRDRRGRRRHRRCPSTGRTARVRGRSRTHPAGHAGLIAAAPRLWDIARRRCVGLGVEHRNSSWTITIARPPIGRGPLAGSIGSAIGTFVRVAPIAIEYERHQRGAEGAREKHAEHEGDSARRVEAETAKAVDAQKASSATAITPSDARPKEIVHRIGQCSSQDGCTVRGWGVSAALIAPTCSG